MPPKSGHTRPGRSHAGVKTKGGGGAADSRKGGKVGGGGGSGALEGGAMATAVIQKKAVGGVSAGVEAQIRSLLLELQRQELLLQQHQQQQQQQQQQQHHRHMAQRGGGGGGGGPAGGTGEPGAATAVDGRTLAVFSTLWNQLLAAGFGTEHIKRVVPELARGLSSPSLEAALDWLCLHLAASELPQKFKSAGGGGGAGGAPVRILAVAQTQHQQELVSATAGAAIAVAGESEPGAVRLEGRSDGLWDQSSDSGLGVSDNEAEPAGAAAAAAAAAAAQGSTSDDVVGSAAGAAATRAAGGGGGGMKEWILRYMDEQASSSEDEREAAEGGTAGTSSCSSVADFEWEVWGDPREVSRRRAERARSRLPPEERRKQLAEEWVRAKEVAARAKATGDKARQKDVGLMIRDLKQEMAALGVTEQQLDQILGGASGSLVAAGQAAGSTGATRRRQPPAGAAVAAVTDKGAGKDDKAKGGKEKAAVKGGKGEKNKGGGKGGDKAAGKGGKGEKAKGGKERDGGQGKGGKGKGKGAGRRAAASPPPSASTSPSDTDSEAEATAPAVPAGRRPVAPKPEDDVVPDSWEDRDPCHSEAAEAEVAVAGGGAVGEGGGSGRGEEVAREAQRAGTREADGAEVAGAGGGSDGDGTAAAAAAEGEPAYDDLSGGDEESPLQGKDADAAPPTASGNVDRSRKAGAAAAAAAVDGDTGFSLPSLFDDDDGSGGGGLDFSTPAAPPSALLRAAAEAVPGPWGEYGKGAGGGKGGKRGAAKTQPGGVGGPGAGAAPEQPKTPRALLSQLCQKQAWSQPRYERLAAVAAAGEDSSGGGGGGGGGAFRYNVVLDLGPARGLAKKRNLYGIRVYGVPAKECQALDGGGGSRLPPPTWPDALTAQDAAAARALYEVTPPLQLQQSMSQSLAPQWRQQWLEWEAADGSAAAAAAADAAGAAVVAAGTAAAAAKQAEEEKLAVLRELLSRPPPAPAAIIPPPPLPFARTSQLATAAAPQPPCIAPPPLPPPLPPPALLPTSQLAACAQEPDAGDQQLTQLEAPQPQESQEPAPEPGPEEVQEGEEVDEGESDSHAEPMTHHDGDAVEQEEWEDMMMALEEPQEEEGEEPQEEEGEKQDQELVTEQPVQEEGPVSEPEPGEVKADMTEAEAVLTDEAQAAQAQAQAQGRRRESDTESAVSASLRAALERWQDSPAGQAMASARAALPIAAVKGELLEALRQGDVVVVSGDTGCGKTTQPRRIAAISVAERVAEERGEPPPGSPGPASTTGYHVRLGAAVTRHTRLTFCTTGILLRRLAGDPSLHGVTHVVVDEVHERSLQSDFLIALLRDLLAARRAQQQQQQQPEGTEGADSPLPPPPPAPALKVVLMSATLDAKLFANYFGGCPVLHAAGRTFPVSRLFLEDVYEATEYRLASDAPAALRRRGPGAAQVYAQRLGGGSRGQRDLVARGFGDDEALSAPLNPEYDPELYVDRPLHVRRNLARLDEHRIDYDLLEALLSYIDATTEPGAVLVFLPGIGEINHLYDRLTAQRAYSGLRGGGGGAAVYGGARCVVLPLHSAVPPAGQRAALRPPPPGLRKVVLATNIAETSLTIEDVVAVVDTGKHKERRFNPARSMSMLVEDWVSAASAQQRAGRAGRVRPGVSYATYTRARFEGGLRRYGAPEITRVPLEELVLQILLMGLGPVSDFLSRVLEPPQPRAVAAALEVLSPLGRQLALLPVGPRLGKLLVLGALLGCLAPAVTIAAAMSHKWVFVRRGLRRRRRSPFLTPADDRGEAERARRALAAPGSEGIAAGQQSDHLLLVAAYELWRVAASPKYGGGTRLAAQVARRHFLHVQTLEQLSEMRCQLAAMLADARLVQPGGERSGGRGGAYGDGDGGGGGFGGGGKAAMAAAAAWLDDPTAPWNKFARDPLVVKAALCAALSPAVAVMGEDSSPTSPPRWTDAAPGAGAGEEVFVHPSSVVAALNTPQLHHPYLVYLEKVKTARLFLRDVTSVSPLCLMLFGGPLTVLHAEGAVLVGAGPGSGAAMAAAAAAAAGNGVLRISCRAQTAVLVKQLRGALNRLLERRYTGGGGGGGGGVQVAESVVGIVRQMLREEDEQRSIAARLL
ncbi:hypothetical protein VOLCADRAFT_86387 [Volvox carteri f. nagariensis]|uniref:Helicase C-terminal domain-containing protein n=1 Tax=Volvox carteri f. nagariensis TaxID=3068 RepID=D8TIM8_VOLCA|nr:uncharacterized protein VOLCADRAFT_86387 [Volvox carteri f. nagariensis]EFJ53272.1 hypothetical protein VOLCADRAFT_86387 [Volvox carteri f. nagariensis]|eukprot:XP_002946277.1 hypothetical protein VOLCADRAFT_86387 [Volvox carteri f. nagariensis]